jgi:hypothetical protein
MKEARAAFLAVKRERFVEKSLVQIKAERRPPPGLENPHARLRKRFPDQRADFTAWPQRAEERQTARRSGPGRPCVEPGQGPRNAPGPRYPGIEAR